MGSLTFPESAAFSQLEHAMTFESAKQQVSFHGRISDQLEIAANDNIPKAIRLLAASGAHRGLLDKHVEINPAANSESGINQHAAMRGILSETIRLARSDDFRFAAPDSFADLPVTGHFDGRTLHAIFVTDAASAAQQVDKMKDTDRLLLLGLGHGGTLPVAITAAALGKYYPDTDVETHVLRFSRTKRHDTRPHVSILDKFLLQHALADRQPVIIEDDRESGKTIRHTIRYLENNYLFHHDPKWLAFLAAKNLRCVTSEDQKKTETKRQAAFE